MSRRVPFLAPVALIATLVAASTLTACGSDDDNTTPAAPKAPTTTTTLAGGGLGGTTWDLSSTKSGSTTSPAVQGTNAGIEFVAGGTLAGSTGCNRFTGKWSVPGTDRIRIEMGAMTKMACTDPAAQAQEEALTTLLPEVSTWTEKAGELTLTTKDGGEVVYTLVTGDLTGTRWNASGVNNGRQALVGTAETEKLTASFEGAGVLSGFGGCNDFTAQWSTDGEGITISAPAATEPKSCGSEADELETQYFAALQAARTYKVAGGTLTLRDAEDAMQVTFRAAT